MYLTCKVMYFACDLHCNNRNPFTGPSGEEQIGAKHHHALDALAADIATTGPLGGAGRLGRTSYGACLNVGAPIRRHRSVPCKFDCVFNIPSDFHSHAEEKYEGK